MRWTPLWVSNTKAVETLHEAIREIDSGTLTPNKHQLFFFAAKGDAIT